MQWYMYSVSVCFVWTFGKDFHVERLIYTQLHWTYPIWIAAATRIDVENKRRSTKTHTQTTNTELIYLIFQSEQI